MFRTCTQQARRLNVDLRDLTLRSRQHRLERSLDGLHQDISPRPNALDTALDLVIVTTVVLKSRHPVSVIQRATLDAASCVGDYLANREFGTPVRLTLRKMPRI
jgi:hypothetical protein